MKHEFDRRAAIGQIPGEEIEKEDGKGILVAGWGGVPLKLLRGHVGWRAGKVRGVAGIRQKLGEAEIGQKEVQPLRAAPAAGGARKRANQKIGRFDIAVNEVTIMRVLERRGGL